MEVRNLLTRASVSSSNNEMASVSGVGPSLRSMSHDDVQNENIALEVVEELERLCCG